MGELCTSRRLLKSLSGKSEVKKVGIIYKIGKEPRLLSPSSNLGNDTIHVTTHILSIPPAALTPPAAPRGCRCRWSHPGRSSSCSECCPGEGWLTTARRSLTWGRRGKAQSAGVPLARVDIYKLPHAVQGGIRSATHCLRVAGRNPTISMAS